MTTFRTPILLLATALFIACGSEPGAAPPDDQTPPNVDVPNPSNPEPDDDADIVPTDLDPAIDAGEGDLDGGADGSADPGPVDEPSDPDPADAGADSGADSGVDGGKKPHRGRGKGCKRR